MARFDPARIRHNFERACGPLRPVLPARVAEVSKPSDPRPEARRLLDGIHSLAKKRYAEHWLALAPFFAEAERLLTLLEVAPGDGTAQAPSELRDALRQALRDIEDLLEVFAELGFG